MSIFDGFMPYVIIGFENRNNKGVDAIGCIRDVLHPEKLIIPPCKLTRAASEWMVEQGINHFFHCTRPSRSATGKSKRLSSFVWMYVDETKAPILRLYFPDLKPYTVRRSSS